MKKILIFSLAYYPHVGGAEVAIKEITDRIADIEFHMVTMRFSRVEPSEEKIGAIVVHRVGPGGGYLSKILFIPRAAAAAARLHARERFDAAWAMMSYMTLPLILMKNSPPYALTLQEGDTYKHMFQRLHIVPFLPLLSQGFRNATVVQAISNYLAGWARSRGFAGPLEIIPNGVDVKKFVGEPVPHHGVVLITTSRLVHKNAMDDCIRALALLPDIRFQVLGRGPDEAALKALAKREGVESRVEFRGHVDQKDIPEALHAADIFVRPSRSEGMGNSFVEAMAAGLPVIATQEGGLKDFISADTAWPVRANNPADIAAAIKDILGNPTRTRQVVENARKMAFEKYDWDLLAREMRTRVFARVLG